MVPRELAASAHRSATERGSGAGELAEQYGVDMPITAQVASVVGGTAPAESAYRGLLKRTVSSERH